MNAQRAGEWLRSQREARSLSQNEVARAVGANDQSAISRWENAKPDGRVPPPEIIEGFARLYDVTPDYIMALYGYVWDQEEVEIHTKPADEIRRIARQLPDHVRRLIEADADFLDALERDNNSGKPRQ